MFNMSNMLEVKVKCILISHELREIISREDT